MIKKEYLNKYGKCLGLLMIAIGIVLIGLLVLEAASPPSTILTKDRSNGPAGITSPVISSADTRGSGGTKNITLYLHNYTATVPGVGDEKIMNSTFPIQMGFKYTSAPSNTFTIDWYLKPAMAAPLIIEGQVLFRIYMAGTGVNNNADLTFTLYNYTQGVDDLIATSTITVNPIHTGINPYYAQVATTAPYKLTNASYLHLEFYLKGNAASGNDWTVYWGNQSYPSLVTIECRDHIGIADAWSTNSTGARKTNFNPSDSNKTIYIRTNITDPFGGDDVSWVNATIYSPYGEKVLDHVPMTRIYGNSSSFWSIYNLSWNYSGHPTGVYTVMIYAVDNTGYYYRFPANPGDETFGGHLETYQFQFTLGKFSYVNVLAQDSKDRALVGAEIVVKAPSGTVVSTDQTNSSGMVNLTLTTGTYYFQVVWEEVLVCNETANITGNWTYGSPLYLNCSVFDAELLIVDALNAPMENASLYIIHPNGSMNLMAYKTNGTGRYALDFTPGGNYTVRVLWRDVVVNFTTVDVRGNETYQINCSVFELVIHATDNIGEDLKGAQVVVANVTSGIVFDSQITNATGNITSQLPVGNYTIEIYWEETLVYHDPGYLIQDNGVYDAQCEVFYLNITAVDSRNEVVVGAQVVVTTLQGSVLDSGVTDATGIVETRLPAGTLSLKIYWQDLLVNQTDSLTITGNTPITANCSIYYLDITTLDSHYSNPKPLGHSRVTLSLTGESVIFTSTETDSQGWCELRLPAASYDINVYWMGIDVYTLSGYSLSDPMQSAILHCNVFYLNVTAEDNDGIHLEDAKISFYLSSGRLIYTDTTTDTGGFTVRLPATNYDIEVVWQEVVVGNIMGYFLSDNGDLTIQCHVFHFNMITVDTHNVPVSDARVEITSGGRTLATGTTDDHGNFSARLPGTYLDITVYWHNHLVNRTENLYLDTSLASSDLVIKCDIFYLTIQLLDSDQVPVDGATVTIYDESAHILVTNESGSDGVVVGRLPQSYVDISVSWMDIVVGMENDYYLGNVTDPVLTINCSIYYLGITAVDDYGIPVDNATVNIELTPTGKLMFSGITDISGQITARLPSEGYDILIRWKGVDVYTNHNYKLLNESDESLMGVCSIYYVTFNLTDDRAVPVSDGKVIVELESPYTLLDTGTTNATGKVVSRLPGTLVDFTVMWKGVTVNITKGYLITESGSVDIFCNIYYLTLRAVDSLGLESLPSAYFMIYRTTNGELIDSGSANLEGEAEFRLPTTGYTIDVIWQDVVVLYDYPYNFTSDYELTLVCQVYYLTLNLVDMKGEPVDLATVWAAVNDTGRILSKWHTDSDGNVTFRLPVNNYDIFATWEGHLVYSKMNYNLTGNANESAVSEIYYLSITARDLRDVPLSDAIISVQSGLTGLTLASAETDDNGVAVLRLPTGPHNIEIHWRDVLVYKLENYMLEGTTADIEETYNCWVYYVELDVVDGKDVPVSDAVVSISRTDSGLIYGTYSTDGNGSTVLRVPKGEYDSSVVWLNIDVNTTTFNVNGNGNLTISAWVYYLTVKAKDVNNLPVAYAEVTVIHTKDGKVYSSGTSDTNGEVVARLPKGDYDIVTRWMGVVVDRTDAHSVRSTHRLEIPCDIYYLTVTVLDKENKGLANVYVEAKNGDGKVVATAETGSDGNVIFRLPTGKYTIHARLRATYEMTPVDKQLVSSVELTQSQSLKMEFKGYPLSFEQTDTFAVVTSSTIILILVIIALFFLLYRPRKSGGSEGKAGTDLERHEDGIQVGEEGIEFVEEEEEEDGGENESEEESLELEEQEEPSSFEEIAEDEGVGGGEAEAVEELLDTEEEIDNIPPEMGDEEEIIDDYEASKEMIE